METGVAMGIGYRARVLLLDWMGGLRFLASAIATKAIARTHTHTRVGENEGENERIQYTVL